MTTATKTAVANGADLIQRKAASDADAVQCGVNTVAIVGSFHRHLLALQQSGVRGEELFNHPVALSFTSKLNSLCRMTLDRTAAMLVLSNTSSLVSEVRLEVGPDAALPHVLLGKLHLGLLSGVLRDHGFEHAVKACSAACGRSSSLDRNRCG